MAENLGILASAIQVTDAAVKLYKVWMGIKGMPENVRAIVEDVNLLAKTLDHIHQESILRSATQQNSPSWTDCFKTLQKVTADFKIFIGDIENHIIKHKKTGPIKAFIKQDKIDEYRDRLERLKTTILLLQNAYTWALISSNFSITLQAIESQRLPGPPNFESAASIVSATDADQSDVAKREVLESGSKSRYTASGRQRYRWRVAIGLPNWMLQKRVQLITTHSYGSWNLNLKVYNVVPSNSAVFEAAAKGDWFVVQRLFNERKATPFDITESGLSLLHIAARKTDAGGCRFLLDQGLDESPQTEYHLSPLEHMCLLFLSSGTRVAEAMKITRMLAHSCESKANDYGSLFMNMFEAPLDVVRFLTTSENLSYDKVQPSQRAQILTWYRGPDPESLNLILGPNLSLSQAWTLLENESCTARENHRITLHNITIPLAYVANDVNAVWRFIDRWGPVIAELITFERQTRESLYFDSPALRFIQVCLQVGRTVIRPDEHGSSWTRKLTHTIRFWVSVMQALGVSLADYADAEKDFFLATPPIRVWAGAYFIRLNGLLCGPCVDDWSLYAVPAGRLDDRFRGHEYEMAGRFWQWTENPELFLVPGAYIDEEDFGMLDMSFPSRYRTAGPIL